MSDREETSLTANGFENDARKKKSNSPSTFLALDSKRTKTEAEDLDSDDIAKQYKRFQNAPKFNLNSEELYCVCRKPDNGTLMISCDGCEEWFHTKCMKIDLQHLGLLDKFYCKFCQWKGKGITRWLHKCRKELCYKPARTSVLSKYCSEECGLLFLKLKLVGSLEFTTDDMNFVVNYCTTYSDLDQLGLKFPELDIVLLLDMEQLPVDVRTMITENDAQRNKLLEELQIVLKNRDYLALIKKRNEEINERANLLVGNSTDADSAKKSKKKQFKPKKTDLCCFAESVRLAVDTDADPDPERDSIHTALLAQSEKSTVYELFKLEIDNALQALDSKEKAGTVCLVDRRKCLRHSGWHNLLQDKLWKRLTDLQESLEKLRFRRDNALREFSISIYENDETSTYNQVPEVIRQTS